MILFSPQYVEDIKETIRTIDCINRLFGTTILITGANGLICSAVVDIIYVLNQYHNAGIHMILAGRDEGRIQERFYYMKSGVDYLYLHFDTDMVSEIPEDVDYYIYGASKGDPAGIMNDPTGVIQANVIGLNAFLNNMVKLTKGRFLYVSSSEVYGKKVCREKAYKEDDYGFIDVLNPRACYPNAKRAAESLCVSYMFQYDLHVVIARPGHIYGSSITETDSRATAQFLRDAHNNGIIKMKSKGQQIRSYCYVFDCASALLMILLKGKRGHAYNISNPDSVVSIAQIAEAIAKESDSEIVYEIPSDQETKSYNLMDNSSLDASALLSLGWKPLFDLDAGVRKTIQHYK